MSITKEGTKYVAEAEGLIAVGRTRYEAMQRLLREIKEMTELYQTFNLNFDIITASHA